MLKSNIDVFFVTSFLYIFCDVISLLAQVFIVSSNRVSQEVYMKNIEKISMGQFCDMTVPSKSNVSSL